MEQSERAIRHVASYTCGTGKLIWEGYLVEGSEDYASFCRLEGIGTFLEKLTGQSAVNSTSH